MADQKPPRDVADERETLLVLLDYQRRSLARKLEGVPESDARRQLVGSGTTLLWLVKHLRRAEITWVERRFAGLPVEVPSDDVQPEDTVAAALEAYRATAARTDALARRAASLDELSRNTGDESAVSLRWILAHLLEETARHAGHADILRELIDGSTGR
ncbi:MAG: DinB family protein [Acidimicrobiales bacterium]|nr:DinB family protein [Acidimicrobiales bacterium]